MDFEEEEDILALNDEEDKPDLSFLAFGEDSSQFAQRMIRNQEAEKPSAFEPPFEPDELLVIRTDRPQLMKIDSEAELLIPKVKDSLEKDNLFYCHYNYSFSQSQVDESPQQHLVGKFHILLAADSFELCNEGVAALNRCLAVELMIANAGTVTTTVFEPIDEINEESIESAEKLNVGSISCYQIIVSVACLFCR